MSISCLNWALKQKTGSGTRKLVLLLICDRADEQNTCYPKIDKLATDSELSQSTVLAAIAWLRDAGLIRVLRRAKSSGGRRSNRYLVCIDGPDTPLPDTEDWVSEIPATRKPPAAGAIPARDDENAGQSKPPAAGAMPGAGGKPPAAGSGTLREPESSKKEDLEPPSGTPKDLNPPPPSAPHAAGPAPSAATADHVGTAQRILDRLLADVDPVRYPVAVERARLTDRIVTLVHSWPAEQLADRLAAMGSLRTVVSVYAVLTSRLKNVGPPPPPPPPPAVLPDWCGALDCDPATRRLLDDDGRPRYRRTAAGREPVRCDTCSGHQG